jgi:hypothetical protein
VLILIKRLFIVSAAFTLFFGPLRQAHPAGVVPNSSFEDAAAGAAVPRGWNFTGPEPATANAWTGDEPFHDKRAIRLDARHGTQEWRSEAFDLAGGKQYLLQWQMRFQGEKSWRFRAKFCGVEVSFQDGGGKFLSSVGQHSNCWQSVGWRPAWLFFSTPKGTSKAVIRFAVETETPLLGGFDVDAVSLETDPREAGAHPDKRLVTLRISDDRGPVTARIHIVDEAGRTFVPPEAIGYSQANNSFHLLRFGDEGEPLGDGKCRFLAAPGRYTITATKGFEYRPWSGSVEVANADVELPIALEREHNWTKRGWLGGDHHTHLFRHGGSRYPFITWADVMHAAKCEGLDFLPFMGQQPETPNFKWERDELRRAGLAVELTDEITDDFWGHVCPIGVSAESRQDPRYSAGPMNIDRDASFGGRGGVLCYAHPYGPMDARRELYAIADPKFGLVAREFPIDLALGMPCGIDLLAMEGNQNQLDLKLRDLYRLYNLDFRPAITASTDFHVDQARQPIGAVRTYVRANELDLTQIAAAYRNGRTFATNGPLIDLKVGDAGPGDEVAMTNAHGAVTVSFEAASIGQLERVEIIVNGEVFQTFTGSESHAIAGKCEVPVKSSLWIAAKVIGPEDRHLAATLEGRPLGSGQIAHTSPIYLIVNKQPIRAAHKSDAIYFINWCDAAAKAWKYHLTASAADTQYDSTVSQRIAQARQVFETLAESLE